MEMDNTNLITTERLMPHAADPLTSSGVSAVVCLGCFSLLCTGQEALANFMRYEELAYLSQGQRAFLELRMILGLCRQVACLGMRWAAGAL